MPILLRTSPVTDYERWLGQDTRSPDSAPRYESSKPYDLFEPYDGEVVRPDKVRKYGWIISRPNDEQPNPSLIPDAHHAAQRTRVPEIVVYYVLLVLLLVLIRVARRQRCEGEQPAEQESDVEKRNQEQGQV
ncbi:hypothetical protein BJX76DRAFT_358010 [Aspergillus varians]